MSLFLVEPTIIMSLGPKVEAAEQSNVLVPCGAYDHNVLGPKGLRARGLEKSKVDVIDVLVVIIVQIVLFVVIVVRNVEQSTVIRIA